MRVFCEGIELGNNGSDLGMISGTYERNGKNRKVRLNRKYDDAEGRVGNLCHSGPPRAGRAGISAMELKPKVEMLSERVSH